MKFTVKEGSFRVADSLPSLHAPAVYGRAVLANGVMIRNPVSSRTEITFTVKSGFQQDADQAALIKTMIAQADNSSVRGLRGMIAAESKFVSDPESVLSLGIEIRARIRYLGDDEEVILFDGVVASFIIDEPVVDDGEVDEFYGALAEARDKRIEAIVHNVSKYLSNYEALMESHATIAGANFDDVSDNDDDQTGAKLDAQTRAVMQAVVSILGRIADPSKNAPPPEELLLQGLAKWLYTNVDGDKATQILTAVVKFIDDSTPFIEFDEDAQDDAQDQDDAETVETLAETLAEGLETETPKRRGRQPSRQPR